MNKKGLVSIIVGLIIIFFIFFIGSCQRRKNKEIADGKVPTKEEYTRPYINLENTKAPINSFGTKKMEEAVKTVTTVGSPIPGWEVVYFGTEPPATTMWPAHNQKPGSLPVMRIRLVKRIDPTPILVGAGMGGITWKISGPYEMKIRKSNTLELFLFKQEEGDSQPKYFKRGKGEKFEPYKLTESPSQFLADMEWVQFTPITTRNGLEGEVEVQFTPPKGFEPELVTTPPAVEVKVEASVPKATTAVPTTAPPTTGEKVKVEDPTTLPPLLPLPPIESVPPPPQIRTGL